MRPKKSSPPKSGSRKTWRLLEAMKQLPSQGDAGKGQRGGQSDRERQLNRLIAELKMVRMLQVRVNRDTKDVDKRPCRRAQGPIDENHAAHRDAARPTGRRARCHRTDRRRAGRRISDHDVGTTVFGSLPLPQALSSRQEQERHFPCNPSIDFLLAAGFFLGLAPLAFAQDDATGTPLEEITHDMKVAASHLSKKTTDKPTQESQDEAVAKLDKLIDELEKERAAMGNSSSPNPSRPATASNGPQRTGRHGRTARHAQPGRSLGRAASART